VYFVQCRVACLHQALQIALREVLGDDAQVGRFVAHAKELDEVVVWSQVPC
jgi:hypothetical protein